MREVFRDVLDNYHESLRRILPFFATHLFFRLIGAALLLPVIGLLLRFTIGFSSQSALTDQDIARFLLTPAGAIGGLLVSAMLIAALILDVAVMTATLHARVSRPLFAIRAGAAFAISNGQALVRFALALLLRILVIALPFLAVGGALFLARLTEFDINYYLSNRPPEFLTTVGLIGLVLVAFAVILLRQLASWSIALHLVLFEHIPVRDSFAESRKRMQGRRKALVGAILIWLAIRVAIGAVISILTGLALAFVPDFFSQSLASAAVAVLIVLALAVFAGTLANALSNGAIADLLNDVYERVSLGKAPEFDVDRLGAGPSSTAIVLISVAAFASLGVLGGGVMTANRISADADVEVIGHRGAAAARPENTMASVEKAIEDGADWVEIDVQESADGEIIVVHDSDFMKSSGVNLKVWDATMADLADIDIGSWFDLAYAEERVPLLRDVLLTSKDRAKVIIELKYYGHDVDLENRVIAIVEETGMTDQIATMSLKYPAVQKMIALRPDWRAGVLAATAIGDLTGLEGDFLAVNLAQVSPRLISRAEAAGKEIYAWTVNDATTMSRMISLGVDGLITDEPALAQQVIRERNALPTSARFALWLSDTFGVAFDQIAGSEIEQ